MADRALNRAGPVLRGLLIFGVRAFGCWLIYRFVIFFPVVAGVLVALAVFAYLYDADWPSIPRGDG